MQSLTGFICPRCRYRVTEANAPFGVCPRDRFALVEVAVFANADGDPLLGMTVADRYVVQGKIGRRAPGPV